MNKTFKKVCGAVCALALSVTALVGCNVITTNTAKYYNQVVVTAGDHSYTKRQLIDTFYNNYYNYVQAGYMTAENAVKNSATYLVERGILVDYIKENYVGEGKELGPLTENDYKAIRKSAWESMQSQLDSLEETIKEERGISTDTSTDEQESTKPLRDEYKEYTPTITTVKDSEDKIHFVYNPELIEDEDLSGEIVPMHFEQKISDDADISREAWTRFVSSLQSAAKTEGRSTAEADVIKTEEDRLISAYTENKYISKYEKYFKVHEKCATTITIDGETYYELNDEIGSNVVTYYSNIYKQQKEKYDILKDGKYEAYYTAMKSYSSSPVLYHPVEDKFMNVTHILINFSETQNAEIRRLMNEKEQRGTDMSDEEYNTRLDAITSTTVVKYNDETGAVVEKNVLEVYQDILNYVDQSADATERAKYFNDMIYRYNDDPGIMNSTFDYAVDLYDDIYGTTENPVNIMVREFTEAARALYTADGNHGAGNLSGLVFAGHTNSTTGKTDYGFHIIMNTGAIKNVELDEDSITAELLAKHTTQLNGYKTLFDYSYDKVATGSNYNTEVKNLVAQLKANIKIVYYENRYKDLWK